MKIGRLLSPDDVKSSISIFSTQIRISMSKEQHHVTSPFHLDLHSSHLLGMFKLCVFNVSVFVVVYVCDVCM